MERKYASLSTVSWWPSLSASLALSLGRTDGPGRADFLPYKPTTQARSGRDGKADVCTVAMGNQGIDLLLVG